MSVVQHLRDCARLRHGPRRRVRCSCGADPHDDAPPERCPACDGAMSALTSWCTPVVVDGFAVKVITCSAEACRAQAEQIARPAIEEARARAAAEIPAHRLAMPVDQQMLNYGYAVTERVVDPKE